jgi:small subunit ribosomal protein S8
MTYVTDPIGDLLTRMRNAQHARKADCRMPWSRMREELLRLLQKEGWVKSVELTGTKPFTEIIVSFDTERPVLELKRVSKPGRRAYISYKDLKPVLNGFGIAVLTTSKGLMTDSQARKERLGGEIICTIS